jgi:hypothetical protein
MLILVCLGTGIDSSEMASTSEHLEEEKEGREVEQLYITQRNLEEEDLLSRAPDEEEGAAEINPDILDITMEDAVDTGPKPNPMEGGEGSSSKTSPTISGSATTAVHNPNEGGTAPKTAAIVTNPSRGVKGSQSINTNPSVSVAKSDSTESNKTKQYLAAGNAYKQVSIPNLNGGGGVPVANIGSFMIEGDNRFHAVQLESDVTKGSNTSYSFNPNNMTCGCCGQFRKTNNNSGGGGEIPGKTGLGLY